jgi:hypothetical protein
MLNVLRHGFLGIGASKRDLGKSLGMPLTNATYWGKQLTRKLRVLFFREGVKNTPVFSMPETYTTV